jgi:molybdopterin synthase catalytic subunit
MEIVVQLTNGSIELSPPSPVEDGIGAWVEFRGLVRGEEDGRPIAALEYEAYSPMAEQTMHRLLTELAAEKPCAWAQVVHRVGIVPVGEAAIHVAVGARHRAEALWLMASFMDRLKQEVPIWKRRAWTAAELAART